MFHCCVFLLHFGVFACKGIFEMLFPSPYLFRRCCGTFEACRQIFVKEVRRHLWCFEILAKLFLLQKIVVKQLQ